MTFREYLNENRKAAEKELKAIASKANKSPSDFKKSNEYLDYLYQNFEKEITAIEKKYKFGMDEFYTILKKLV